MPTGLEAELTAAFDPGRCSRPATAEREVRSRLDRLGLTDWTINSHATKSDQCVYWSLVELAESPRTVTLLPAVSPDVRDAFAGLREEAFAACMTKEEVIARLESTLTRAGASDFVIRTDGPFQIPLDREKELLAHYEAGCWMLSTYGWLDERFNFFVSGK